MRSPTVAAVNLAKNVAYGIFSANFAPLQKDLYSQIISNSEALLPVNIPNKSPSAWKVFAKKINV